MTSHPLTRSAVYLNPMMLKLVYLRYHPRSYKYERIVILRQWNTFVEFCSKIIICDMLCIDLNEKLPTDEYESSMWREFWYRSFVSCVAPTIIINFVVFGAIIRYSQRRFVCCMQLPNDMFVYFNSKIRMIICR